MRKKILDAALIFAFTICLIVTSNIQESVAKTTEASTEASTEEQFSGKLYTERGNTQLCSGVAIAISANSFTIESDEKTGINKKDVVLVTSSNDSENRWNIRLTEEEIDLLAKIVWLEANGEPAEGQEAVVEVVFNRMASDLYPDTLYDVLSQNNPVQFTSWKKRDKAQPTETEYQSIYNVLNGNTDLLRNDTMNFSTYPLTSNLDVKICCHYFCY